MKRLFSLFLLLSSTACFAYPIVKIQHPMTNLDHVTQQLQKYHDSGKYRTQQTKIDNQALMYLKKRIEDNNTLAQPKKLAVVFDIDETLLSNYPYMARQHFGGPYHQFDVHIMKANEPAIIPTAKLFHYATQHHVAVFIVTGRRTYMKHNSIMNLRKTGLTGWTGLYFKPMHYHSASAAPFKTWARKDIELKGYDIVLTIGDQFSDIEGGYADRGYKLPNPFYYIP